MLRSVPDQLAENPVDHAPPATANDLDRLCPRCGAVFGAVTVYRLGDGAAMTFRACLDS